MKNNNALLYVLLKNISENNLKKFKHSISLNILECELVDAYEQNKKNPTDELIRNSISKQLTDEEYNQLNKNTSELLLGFLHENFFSENTSEKLKKDLELAYIMCSYGYVEEGIEKIYAIKKKAEIYNHFDAVSVALDYILKFDDSYKLKPEKAVDISNMIDENLALISNLNSYTHLSLQIYSYQNILNVDEETIKKYLSNPLLKDKTKPKSTMARYYYYMALMDSYSLIKDYKSRLDVVNSAVAYFKAILRTTDFYFSKYFFLLERKAHTELLLKKHNELKKTVDIIQNLNIPDSYLNNPNFIFKLEDIKLHYLFSYCLVKDKDKAFSLLQNDFKSMLKNHTLTSHVQHTYYTMIFHYAVKFQSYHEVLNLTPDFMKFFNKKHLSLDPNRTNLMQIFLCIFLSAFKNFNKNKFIHFYETVINSKSKELFNKDTGDYHYVEKMYDLILEAYDKDFFNKTVFEKYVKLWSFKPDIHDKVVCISQNTLLEDYNKSKNDQWNKKYENACF